MINTLLIIGLLATQSQKAEAHVLDSKQRSLSCPAAYLEKLLPHHGVPDSWNPSKIQYSAIRSMKKELIRDYPIDMSDGFSHWLYLDEAKNIAYVVQIGGFTDSRTVYGPFPAAQCKANNG